MRLKLSVSGCASVAKNPGHRERARLMELAPWSCRSACIGQDRSLAQGTPKRVFYRVLDNANGVRVRNILGGPDCYYVTTSLCAPGLYTATTSCGWLMIPQHKTHGGARMHRWEAGGPSGIAWVVAQPSCRRAFPGFNRFTFSSSARCDHVVADPKPPYFLTTSLYFPP